MDEELNPQQDMTGQTEDPGMTAPPMEDMKPDPGARFKQYLQAQMAQNQRRQSPEYLNARDQHQDNMAGMKDQANLGALLFDSAGKFGSVAGKATPSSYGTFAQGLNSNIDAQAAREEQNQKQDDASQDKNGQLYKYLVQQQAQDRKDVIDQRTATMQARANDPKSSAANQGRGILQATLRQKARVASEAGDLASSKNLLDMATKAGEGMTAPEIEKMHNQIKDLNYDDLLNMQYKKANLGAINDQRAATRSAGDEKLKASLLGSLGKDLDDDIASSRSALGVAANKKAGAERLFSFAETSPKELDEALKDPQKKSALSAKLDAMTPQQKAEIVSGLMTQVTPGSQSLGQFEHLNQLTGEERIAKLRQYFLNEPAGANAGDFILKNLTSINNEYKTSKSQLKEHADSLRDKHLNTFNKFPDESNQMLEAKLKRLAGSDERVANMISPAGNPTVGGDGTAIAAPGGVGKQIVRRQHSDKLKQTKVTYSDGTTEVVND